METITLNTGASMPLVGLGTWKSDTGEVGRAVEFALEAGYRHIDCAAAYLNESEVGESLSNVFKQGQLKREDVFVTSKLWNMAHKAEDVRPRCEATLRDLKLDYLDLYLMHWGTATSESQREVDENGVLRLQNIPVRETWEAMQELVQAGLVKSIGVANFTVAMLIDLLTYAKLKPAMNQVELHPYLQQRRLVEFCQYRNIAVTAYSPLGSPGNFALSGAPLLREDLVIKNIGEAHGKTPAQVLIRWAIERNTVAIPKSVHKERIEENINVFDFKLSPEDMKAIEGLERNLRFVDPYQWGKIPYFD